jgi:hypothetical protein
MRAGTKPLAVFPLFLCVLLSGARNGDDASRSGRFFGGGIPGPHRGPVSVLVHSGDGILSGGEDGFLEIWDVQNAAA